MRPHLEHAQCIWSQYKKKLILCIENVQRKATKIIKNIKHLTYEERLRYLDLPSLVYRRAQGDIMETYKIVSGMYDIAVTPYLQPCKQNVKRGHNLKLAKSYSRLNVRYNIFSLRITNLWNSLTEDIVTAPSLNAFENKLNKHWQNTSFNPLTAK